MLVVAELERQVAAALRRAGFSGNRLTIVVGASGGPDSTALLHCLHRLQKLHGLSLHVAHLNHDFRGDEADEDARFVASLAENLGLRSTVDKQNPLEYQRQTGVSSFEQAAREMRYAFLAGVAKDVGAVSVAVGHTADDQAETVLLHVLRGSGLHGLRGMAELTPWPWSQQVGGLKLFRPLLGMTKADTVAYLKAQGRDYREDSGNYLPGFTRNRVRHNLLPLLASEFNPRIRESLLRLARTASLDLDYLEEVADRVWGQVAEEGDGRVRFPLPSLEGQHPALQRLLLRRGYALLMGHARRLRESHLAAMAALVAGKATGGTVVLPGGMTLKRSYEYLVMSRDAGWTGPLPQLDGEHSLQLPTVGGPDVVQSTGGWRVTLRAIDPPQSIFEEAGEQETEDLFWSARLDRAALGGRLVVRTRRPGDRFRPLGMAGEKKLQDFFVDAKVPRDWRDRVPLLVSERGIAWAVGYRIADWAKIETGQSPARPAVSIEFESQTSHI